MILWMLLFQMREKLYRLRYAEERKNPEWVDLGGEA